MKFLMKRRRARLAFLLSLVMIIASILSISIAFRSISDQPRNTYLDRVTEPIRIETGFSLSDGGSMSLSFQDNAGIDFAICLENSIGRRDEGRRNLILGAMLPGKDELRVPIAGSEEKQLLQILKRWTEYDETGRAIEADHKQLRGTPAFSTAIEKYRDSQYSKFIAWCIYDRLRSPYRRSNSSIRRFFPFVNRIL